MEVALTLAEPRLDQSAVVGVHWLIRLGMLNILGIVMLGALGLSPLPVMLQGAIVMLQLDVLGMKMFVFLGHLGNTSTEALHFCLEIDICRRFLSGGTLAEGMVLSIVAILSRHSRVWGEEEVTTPDGRRSQLGW